MLLVHNFSDLCLISYYLVPLLRDVKMEYKILKEKIREYNKKDAQFYSNIFAKMHKNEPAKQDAVPMAIDSKA